MQDKTACDCDVQKKKATGLRLRVKAEVIQTRDGAI